MQYKIRKDEAIYKKQKPRQDNAWQYNTTQDNARQEKAMQCKRNKKRREKIIHCKAIRDMASELLIWKQGKP